jgi:hypothetical protein
LIFGVSSFDNSSSEPPPTPPIWGCWIWVYGSSKKRNIPPHKYTKDPPNGTQFGTQKLKNPIPDVEMGFFGGDGRATRTHIS